MTLCRGFADIEFIEFVEFVEFMEFMEFMEFVINTATPS